MAEIMAFIFIIAGGLTTITGLFYLVAVVGLAAVKAYGKIFEWVLGVIGLHEAVYEYVLKVYLPQKRKKRARKSRQ